MGSVFSKQELELLLNVIQLRIDYQLDKGWSVGNPLWDMEKKLKDLLAEYEKKIRGFEMKKIIYKHCESI